jgi:hypothetical protein
MSESARIAAIAVSMVAMAATAPAHAHEAHVHGVAKLDVAIEGDTVTLMLDSPLANVLGFEHPPHTEVERQAVAAADARLRQGASLFVLTPDAKCIASATSIHSPLADWKNGTAHQETAHADLEAEYVFKCSQPGRLRDVSVLLFEHFKGFSHIDTQWIGPSGQGGAKLTPKAATLRW